MLPADKTVKVPLPLPSTVAAPPLELSNTLALPLSVIDTLAKGASTMFRAVPAAEVRLTVPVDGGAVTEGLNLNVVAVPSFI
jgi:hypothetical protein